MLLYAGLITGALAAAAALAVGAQAGEGPGNLVANPNFAAGEGEVPAGWTVWKPVWEHAACTVRRTEGGLLVEAPQEPYAVGGAWQDIGGIEGGQAYAVDAVAEVRNISSPFRSVLVRLEWRAGKKLVHPAGMLARLAEGAGGKAVFSDVFVAPKEADGARLSLEVKWPQGGTVLWKRVSVRPAVPLAPRKVKIGTVYLRPKDSTPEKNMALWCAQVDAAGKLGLDIVCLSEAILQVGTGADLKDLAKPVPRPGHGSAGRGRAAKPAVGRRRPSRARRSARLQHGRPAGP